MDKFKTEFLSQLYDYYMSNNHKVYLIKPNSGGRHLYSVHKDNIALTKTRHANEYPSYPYSKKDFLESLYEHHYIPNSIDNSSIKTDFPIHFFNNNSDFRKDFSKVYPYILGNIKNSFENFLDHVTNNKAEAMSLILKFPVSVWGATEIPLESIKYYLEKKGATQPDLEKFFLSFLKPRKTHLTDPKNGPKIRDFLTDFLERDISKLELYFDFFPFLKNEFKQKDYSNIDLFEGNYSQSAAQIFNIKKMKKCLLLDGWDESKYENSLTILTAGLKKYYTLDIGYLESFDKKDQTHQMTFLHNNPLFTTELLKKTSTDFYIHMISNSTQVLDTPYVATWISQYELEKKLAPKDIIPIKKHKL
jgi:hypothetical protein